MENVKRVKVFTKNGKKAYIIEMGPITLKTAKRLKVYAANDGYLCYENKFGERCMFTRYLMGVINPDEIVTYKNGNHLDLRLENLEVISKGERGKRNLSSEKGQKVEANIYYLQREQQYMVSFVDNTGKRHCPRAKTLEEARKKLQKLQNIYKK